MSLTHRRRGTGSVPACLALAALAATALPQFARAQTTVNGVIVPGSANPFLAGMPDGSTASGDSAPAQLSKSWMAPAPALLYQNSREKAVGPAARAT